MNNKNTFLVVLMATGLIHASSASAILFDQNVTPDVIFGSGNANGAFTVDQNNGIELGLRGKLRHNASGAPENTFNSNGDGTYSFMTGVAPTQSFPTAVWSFEWSINSNFDSSSSNNLNLDDLMYRLGYDSDPTQGTSFTEFDPINAVNPSSGAVFWDHAIGNNSTSNGAGVVATDASAYATLIEGNNVAQNSWKAHWFLSSFDPTVDGTYDFYLAAFDSSGLELARTEMQIIAGAGGVAVPEPTTLLLLSVGIFGMGFARKRTIS